MMPAAFAEWTSVLPPVIAIGLALGLRSVVPAIFAGVWAGMAIEYGFSAEHLGQGFADAFQAHPEWMKAAAFAVNLGKGFLDAFQVRIFDAMLEQDHVSIMLFTGMIGGMVGVISRNGGMQGVVRGVMRWANSARRGQLSVWFLGLCVFFDDYTNTLVVGNTVRPVTDKLKISREKLAYLVDSTAAPVACLALLTTWIGYELGLISEAIKQLNGFEMAATEVFLNSILYSFYPILALFFVFWVGWTGRDFGPMLAAERRCRGAPVVAIEDAGAGGDAGAGWNEGARGHANAGGADGSDAGANSGPGAAIPPRAINAVAPILTLVAGCLSGLYISGEGDTLFERISTADVYLGLLWGSFLGASMAGGLTWAQRIMPLDAIVQSWIRGVQMMVTPLTILVLAWALSETTAVLGTADFLVSLLGERLQPALLPAVIFLVAAVTAFATGSSWGVMAILLPLAIPVTWAAMLSAGISPEAGAVLSSEAGDILPQTAGALPQAAGALPQAAGAVRPEDMHLLFAAVASVLCGAVWGDHCSPISDTTVLSSLSAGCDHIEHVRTQMPYALLVGAAAVFACLLPVARGLPWWAGLLAAMLSLAAALRFIGKRR